jgi:hypothetical protein
MEAMHISSLTYHTILRSDGQVIERRFSFQMI